MAGEQLNFDIFARLREDGFAKAGKAASAASDDVMGLAHRLDELAKKSATARVQLAGDKEALAALDKLDLKLLTTGRRVVDPKITLDGAAKAQAEIAGLDVSLDKLAAKSAGATAAVGSSSGGLAGPAGMGALIGAGVALSPVLATVAVGVGGVGAAAIGAVGPIAKAAQATGGLKANMAALDPEQRKLARSVLGLENQYQGFSKSLEPQVLDDFSKGVSIAGHVMHDVQPVAAATGKALGGMLGQVDAEFQSGTWQNFFGFMAKTAGPDIQLLTNNFTDFMEILPPLLTDLQPVATGLLQITDDALKLAGAAVKVADAERTLATGASNSSGFLGKLANAAGRALGVMEPAIPVGQKLAHAIGQQADASSKAAPSLHDLTGALGAAVTAEKKAATSTDALTASMQKNIGTVLTLQGDEVGWQQSLQAATKQLGSNSAGLRGNSKDALANKAAVLQATQGAVSFAENQLNLGHNLQGASRDIQAQIHWLQIHGGKSRFARDEVHALRMEENKLQAVIRNKILVSASGFWKVTGALQGGTPQSGGGPVQSARGMYVRDGQPGVDDQLILAQRGELVVPVSLVKAGLTDHLRGMIPGFAQGGVISSYSGSVGGGARWLAREDAATLRAVEVATAAATAAGIKSAQAAASGGGFGVAGPGGGAPAANAALARRMFPSVDWPSWNYVAMRESGWNQFARNPSSGAYGIPQALPPSKMGPAANPPQSNPAAQISWMVGYMNSRYGGSPGAAAHERAFNWYAQGGVVGGVKHHQDPQRKAWLAQLARDVRVLEEDQKHARARRKILRHSVEIDELWFLTHPHVRPHGIGWNEHERALRNDQRRLSHFNRREADREKTLAAKIAILRDLTGFPKGVKYGGPGTPGPDPGAGDGGGDLGGGDTGGGPVTAPAPPPIPPPPMPAWMVAAGLGAGGGSGVYTARFPGQAMTPAAMSWPEPATFGGGMGMGGWGGSRNMGGGGLAEAIAAIQAMHRDLVGAVGQVAPRTARGFDQSQNSMAARIASRFS